MALDLDQLRAFAARYTEGWCSRQAERVAAHYAPQGSLTINDGPPLEPNRIRRRRECVGDGPLDEDADPC